MEQKTNTCSLCGQTKDVSEFYASRKRADGLQRRCKSCHLVDAAKYRAIHGDIYNANKRADSAKNPEKYHDYYLRSQYKITLAEFNKKLQRQRYRCACCGASAPGWKNRWCVDHAHACCPGSKSCGRCVRDLLCVSCNAILGYAQDDPKKLQLLMAYLEKHKA